MKTFNFIILSITLIIIINIKTVNACYYCPNNIPPTNVSWTGVFLQDVNVKVDENTWCYFDLSYCWRSYSMSGNYYVDIYICGFNKHDPDCPEDLNAEEIKEIISDFLVEYNPGAHPWDAPYCDDFWENSYTNYHVYFGACHDKITRSECVDFGIYCHRKYEVCWEEYPTGPRKKVLFIEQVPLYIEGECDSDACEPYCGDD